MSAQDTRRDPRVPVRVRVVLVHGGKELSVVSEDVSLQGVRVRTDVKLPARQLLKLRLPVGEGGAELPCQGMVVHTDPSEVDGTPTLGIQFYAFDGEVRDAWSRLVNQHRRPAQSTPPPTPATQEPIRRQHARRAARATVYIASMDDLITFTTVNISRGGMFLATPTPPPVGATLRLEMRNPDTHPFVIEAVVRRVEPGHDPPGIAVEFLSAPDDSALEALSGEPEDAPMFVTSYDPNLA